MEDDVRAAFNAFDFRRSGRLSVNDAHLCLTGLGISLNKPTLASLAKSQDHGGHPSLDFDNFLEVVKERATPNQSKDALFLAFTSIAGPAKDKTRSSFNDCVAAAHRARIPDSEASFKIMLREFAEYPTSGLSFPEWQTVAALAAAPRKPRIKKAPAPPAAPQAAPATA